ncbi:MAG: hypothetical protein Hals2KO_21220 [Halioglobus sp.]
MTSKQRFPDADEINAAALAAITQLQEFFEGLHAVAEENSAIWHRFATELEASASEVAEECAQMGVE